MENLKIKETMQRVDVGQCQPLGGEHHFSLPFLHLSPTHLQLNAFLSTKPIPKEETYLPTQTHPQRGGEELSQDMVSA